MSEAEVRARREAIKEAQALIRDLRDGATADGNYVAASCAEWIAVAIGALAGIPDCPICAEMNGRKCVNHRDDGAEWCDAKFNGDGDE